MRNPLKTPAIRVSFGDPFNLAVGFRGLILVSPLGSRKPPKKESF
jgi:hypothetical protein